MKSLDYVLLERRYWKLELIVVLMIFFMPLANVFFPERGIKDFPDLLWTSVLFGTMLGLLTFIVRGRDLTAWQRWQLRLLSFGYYFLVTFIAGGLGLLIFK